MTPFLDLTGFQDLWDGPPLTTQQQALTGLLLSVASNWIYENGPAGPNLSPTDPAAQLVTYEVVANTLRFQKYGPLKDFSSTTAHRTESGSLDNPATALDFTDRHKVLLGIPVSALPMSSCVPDDFEAPDCAAGWTTGWSVPSTWNYGAP